MAELQQESPVYSNAPRKRSLPRLRTIVLVIDGLVPGDVRPGLIPQLCRGAHCPGTTAPDSASHSTLYALARAAMLTQTNANFAAMMTGEYSARSGLIGNAYYNRTMRQELCMEDPPLIAVPTIFDLFAGTRAETRGQSPFSGASFDNATPFILHPLLPPPRLGACPAAIAGNRRACNPSEGSRPESARDCRHEAR